MMQRSHLSVEPQFGPSRNRPPTQIDKPDHKKTAERVDKAARILIVEDDFFIAMEAESALLSAGLTVIGVATSAEEALALARAHKPALAIMDIRLGRQRDGVEAAGDLFRELGVRCVFATAHDDQQVRTRAEPFEPLGWLTKPYTMTSLVKLVREAISRMG
jgi:two-component system, response regulator PdtaR